MQETSVSASQQGIKLHRFLQKTFSIPFSLMSRLLREKKIKVNHKKCSLKQILEEGDKVQVYARFSASNEVPLDPTTPAFLQQIERWWQKISIIYSDDNILVINKPAKLASQGGSKISICLIDVLEAKLGRSVFLTHRLDKDTSGIMLLAKSVVAAQLLSKLFVAGLKKEYIALVHNHLPQEEGYINTPIERDGKTLESSTYYQVLDSTEHKTLVRCVLLTGRYHQIRIHLSSYNCPVVGDDQHGKLLIREESNFLYLHAKQINIQAPLVINGTDYTGKTFVAPLPSYWDKDLHA